MVANTNGSLLYVFFSTKAFVSPNGIIGEGSDYSEARSC